MNETAGKRMQGKEKIKADAVSGRNPQGRERYGQGGGIRMPRARKAVLIPKI